MAELSTDRAEVNARIVYWGAEGAGASENLLHVSRKLRSDHRGELARHPTALDPTVTYEVLPITLGEIAGMQVRLQVVAVPGAPEHAPTRKQLLDRADGVVLVVDSSPDRIDANLAAFDELRRTLSAYGRSLDELPLVLQYNKRDRADEFTLEELHRKLDVRGAAVFEAVASQGKGVLQTLTTISKAVIRVLRESGFDALPTPTPGAPEPVPVEPEPVLEPEPLPEPEPILADPVADGIAAEERDPQAAAEVAGLAAEAQATLDASWGELTAPVAGVEAEAAPLAGVEAEAAPVALGGDLSIDSIGSPRRAGDRGLVVPLVLRDAEGRTFSVRLALTLDLLGGPREE